MHHIFLIPGFFGFANLGQVQYFRAVRETLEHTFTERGEQVQIFGVKTLPTGSLKKRAGRVLDAIAEENSLQIADHIHLIGHSTGGIDARIVASTTRDIGRPELRAALEKKLRTVVCIASPHHGTPLANFFATLYGKKLLYLVTLLVFVGLWRKPISAAAGVLGLGFRATDLFGVNETMLRQITRQLLKDFTPEREREVRTFLNSILEDVSLMMQLTPEAMDILDATLTPLPDVRIVSYGTVSPPPSKTFQRASLRDLLTPLGTILYSTLYTIASQPESGYDYHPISKPEHRMDLMTKAPLPFNLSPSANDGIVPALSQIHGEFRGFVQSDHLDVVGHYLRGPLEKQDGADWFTSGARFDLARFHRVWRDVTDVCLG